MLRGSFGPADAASRSPSMAARLSSPAGMRRAEKTPPEYVPIEVADLTQIVRHRRDEHVVFDEREATKEAILDVFPNADVRATRLDDYPIVVNIRSSSFGVPLHIFSCSQRDLFRKYFAKRTATQQLIKRTLMRLVADE